MVGLSIVLEGHKSSASSSKQANRNDDSPLVINKTTMIVNKPSSSSSSSCGFGLTFLDQCFLCNQKLLPSKDIYMYKGDRAFCSVDCRYRQIFMDEEESIRKENCSFAASKPTSSSRHRKRARNRAL